MSDSREILNASLRDTTFNNTVPSPPRYMVINVTLFLVVIFLIGVIGNSLVIVVVVHSRNMRTSVNYFLVNLCIADLLLLILCMPTALVDIYAQDIWYFGKLMCKLVPFLENTVASASVLTILAISSERYKVICRPLRAPSRGSCGFVKVIVGLWLMAFATSSPFLAITVYRNSRHVDGTLIKVCRTTINETWEKCFIVLLSSFFFTIPLSILIGLYCRVGRQLFAFREDGMNIGEKKFKEKLRLRRQVTNMIVTVVVMFFICHLPYRLIGLWLIFDPMVAFSWGFEKYLNIIYGARVILYLNHALNPIMYNFVSSKFRSSLKWMIYSLPKKRQGSSKYTSANNNRRLGFRSHSPNSRFKCSQSEIKEVQVSDRQANTDSRSSSSVRQHINDFSNMYSTLTSAPHMTSVTHRTSADHTTPADLTAECDCAEQLRPQKTLSCDTPNVHFCIQSSKIYISLNMDVQTDRDKNNHHPRHENEAGAFEETSY